MLRTVLAIHKMRGSAHSHDFLSYDVSAQGAVVGAPLRNYRGILTGVPEQVPQLARAGHEGLTERESTVLNTLVRLGGASRAELAERVGVANAELAETIDRLHLLGYVRTTRSDGEEILHAVAQGVE